MSSWFLCFMVGYLYEEVLVFFIFMKFICSYGMEISQSAMVKNLQDNGQRTRRCLRDLEVCRLQTGLGLTECMLPASKNLAEISGLSTVPKDLGLAWNIWINLNFSILNKNNAIAEMQNSKRKVTQILVLIFMLDLIWVH